MISMLSVLSRFMLRSTEFVNAFVSGVSLFVGLQLHFVAMMYESRGIPCSACPSHLSLSPLPYPAAVSNRFTPRSIACAMSLCRSLFVSPAVLPNCPGPPVPYDTRDVLMFDFPSVLYSMVVNDVS